MPSLPLDVRSLIASLEAGNRFEYRFFWVVQPKNKGPLSDDCFTQWWLSPFIIDGRTYTSAEQWMMSSKARLFGDVSAEQAILSLEDPAQIKAVGRRVQGFVQEVWDASCLDIVTVGNVAKFGQDARLGAYLLATGDQVLVEASPTDLVWGIGCRQTDPEAMDPRCWRGQNLLGFALMRTRGVLRGELELL